MRWLIVAIIMLLPVVAGADAVRPPPKSCPEGRVPVTSHAGPRCELEAPKDCPPGWRGVIGGQCRLNVCHSDAQCRAAGETCVPVSPLL